MFLALATILLGQAVAVLGAQPPILPLPSSFAVSGESLSLDHTFKFTSKKDYGSVVNKAMDRYKNLINVPSGSTGSLKSCKIFITKSGDVEIVNSDESYELHVGADGSCEISSETVWGALRGMESFTHFLVRNSATNSVDIVNSVIDVKDSPRFGHRGMLIDTARHYLTTDTIRKVIDAMPISKFNVLHWHSVDAESFPVETPSEPMMTKSAFTPSMIYTPQEIQSIVEYAHDRGVEIIFEVDVPGHAAGWALGKPEIMADCMQKYTNINNYALDVSMDETYVTLGHILSDIVTASGAKGSSRLHIGGDEVVYGCWSNDADIVAFMAKQGYTSYAQLFNYFIGRADGIVAGLNKTAIHWEEVFTSGCSVSHDNIFQVWTDSSIVSQITAADYKVIASPSNYWYLNIASNTWQVAYSYNPTANLTSTAQRNNVVGGEVALWGEYVDDQNIISMLYPRASAAAERLWSPESVTDQSAAQARLIIQRCRLLNRGFSSAPVLPAGYCDTVPV